MSITQESSTILIIETMSVFHKYEKNYKYLLSTDDKPKDEFLRQISQVKLSGAVVAIWRT